MKFSISTIVTIFRKKMLADAVVAGGSGLAKKKLQKRKATAEAVYIWLHMSIL